MSEWKTIESAPKDRDIVVIDQRVNGGYMVVARWVRDCFETRPSNFKWTATHWCDIPEFKPTQKETNA